MQLGTILIFKHGNGIAVHRVIRLDGDIIVTKGDANPKEDEPITFGEVVGRLPTWWGREGKIPWVGKLVLLGAPEVSPSLEDQSQADALGIVGAFRRILGNPFALIVLVVLPLILLFALLAMEIVPRVGPGREKHRWRQRLLERMRRRRIPTKFAFRWFLMKRSIWRTVFLLLVSAGFLASLLGVWKGFTVPLTKTRL